MKYKKTITTIFVVSCVIAYFLGRTTQQNKMFKTYYPECFLDASANKKDCEVAKKRYENELKEK